MNASHLLLRGAALCLTIAARTPANADPLEGLWVAELAPPPALHGALRLEHQGSRWRGRLAGRVAESTAAAGELRLSFPDRDGEFRATLGADERLTEGFWVQPAAAIADAREAGSRAPAFASPLRLETSTAGRIRAEVVPLRQDFTLYLKVLREADGSLLAAFRNRQLNSRGGAPQFRALPNGQRVEFSATLDGGREVRLAATWLHSPERLRLEWPDLGRTIELVHAGPRARANFSARPPAQAPYRYRAPERTGDGWETAAAGEVGLDEAALARLIERIAATDPAARRPALIHSLLVAYRGKLVLEQYFFGHGREQPHDLRSAGKSFASVMLGTALRSGALISPETAVYELLAGRGPFAAPDPRKAKISVANLLTHTSGLACDDNDDDSPGNEDTMQRQSAQPDWWKYTLNLPLTHDPGSRYAYCSGGMNLAGAALTQATRTWLPAWFDRTVARPLDFGRYYWNLMPNGEGYLGGGAFMRPRDLLKIGEVYVDGGTWRGRRIVDGGWIERSTAAQQEVTPASTGLDPERFHDFYAGGADGYAWHLSTLESGGRHYREYAATGNGGQVLSVVPELGLAVVFTAGNYGQGGIWGRFRDGIVGGEIIPAIRH
jgi:CubicO group peptidase (beta-lactamase class C family)